MTKILFRILKIRMGTPYILVNSTNWLFNSFYNFFFHQLLTNFIENRYQWPGSRGIKERGGTIKEIKEKENIWWRLWKRNRFVINVYIFISIKTFSNIFLFSWIYEVECHVRNFFMILIATTSITYK